ncbi:MAG: hypothetical protein KBC15_03830 [Candidatus Levybacteria bacterium]|nr:hypothetical protein [Candidatus Levybacteria bacterium]
MELLDWLSNAHIQPIYSLTGPWGAMLPLFFGLVMMNALRLYFREGVADGVWLRYWNSFMYGECIFIPLYGLFAGLALQKWNAEAWYTEAWIFLGFIGIGLIAAGINILLGLYHFKLEHKTWMAKTEQYHIFGSFPVQTILIGTSIVPLLTMWRTSFWADLALFSLIGLVGSIASDWGKKKF